MHENAAAARATRDRRRKASACAGSSCGSWSSSRAPDCRELRRAVFRELASNIRRQQLASRASNTTRRRLVRLEVGLVGQRESTNSFHNKTIVTTALEGGRILALVARAMERSDVTSTVGSSRFHRCLSTTPTRFNRASFSEQRRRSSVRSASTTPRRSTRGVFCVKDQQKSAFPGEIVDEDAATVGYEASSRACPPASWPL